MELRKRLLQTAAIAVNLLTKMDNGIEIHTGIHPTLPSNLPEYTDDNNDLEEIERLQMSGHSGHCAQRIVWGDGECECGITKKFENKN